MTIFQLMVYSCVTTNGLDGELLSKVCRWDAGAFYVSREKCEAEGRKRTGEPILSFIHEDRRIEHFKVQPITVIE